jgi:sigma-B regulation protein RsbU (phosphoserine phosphatase)
MIQFRQSIGFRLLVLSFILLAMPLLVDSFILIQSRYQQAIEDARGLLLEVANMRVLPFERLQPLDKPLIELIIDDLELEGNFPQYQSAKLNEKLKLLSEIGKFYGIFIIKITSDKQFYVVASSRPEYLGKDYTTFFQLNQLYSPSALERGYVDYIFLEKNTLRPFLIVVDPVFSFEEERYVGVLALTHDVADRLEELLLSDTRSFRINFALLLPSTVIFASTDPELKFQYFQPLSTEFKQLFLKEDPSAVLPKQPLPVSNAMEYPYFEFTWRGQPQIGYVKQLPNANYSLLAYASKTEIFAAPLLEFFDVYSIYGIILIVGGTVATLLIMQMAKPIQNLGAVMQRIQSGEIHLRYEKDPLGFEINTLGEIFNEMVNAVLTQKHMAEEERVKQEIFIRELRLGQQVQRSLLPQKMPEYPGVELSEIYIPALEVGGDFYDVFIKDTSTHAKLVLCIADVSGKGVQACFYSLSVRNMLRIYAKHYDDIAQALLATNDLFSLDTGETGMFVTVLCGIYDFKTHVLSYFSCGHNPAIVRKADGSIYFLEHTGMAIGVAPSERRRANEVQLFKGDTLVFYTDGVTEAHNEHFDIYGEERLVDCLKQEGAKGASQIVEAIVGQVNHFAGSMSQHDDITLLVMKITE